MSRLREAPEAKFLFLSVSETSVRVLLQLLKRLQLPKLAIHFCCNSQSLFPFVRVPGSLMRALLQLLKRLQVVQLAKYFCCTSQNLLLLFRCFRKFGTHAAVAPKTNLAAKARKTVLLQL